MPHTIDTTINSDGKVRIRIGDAEKVFNTVDAARTFYRILGFQVLRAKVLEEKEIQK